MITSNNNEEDLPFTATVTGFNLGLDSPLLPMSVIGTFPKVINPGETTDLQVRVVPDTRFPTSYDIITVITPNDVCIPPVELPIFADDGIYLKTFPDGWTKESDGSNCDTDVHGSYIFTALTTTFTNGEFSNNVPDLERV